MKARLIPIGKSKGIRIPPSLLKKSQLGDEVQLEAMEGQITIRSKAPAREGWEQDFKQMAVNGDNKLFREDPLLLTEWDETEW